MPVFKREGDKWVWTNLCFPNCMRFMVYADAREFDIPENSLLVIKRKIPDGMIGAKAEMR